MLKIKNVSKIYSGTPALNRVDLSLPSRQTHILLGSSGSGKSTLLRAILGLISCDQGEIQFEDKAMTTMTQSQRAALMGYVPQEGGLFPHLTAEQNATLVARAQGWSKDRIQNRLKEVLDVVLLRPAMLPRFPSEMSGGQRQRVALLRAAFMDPQLLLMDEPLGALDPLVRAELQTELKESFKRLNKTVVFVTHDIGEASYLGDHIVLMHEGRVVQTGRMKDLRERPASDFVTRFLNAQRIYEKESVE